MSFGCHQRTGSSGHRLSTSSSSFHGREDTHQFYQFLGQIQGACPCPHPHRHHKQIPLFGGFSSKLLPGLGALSWAPANLAASRWPYLHPQHHPPRARSHKPGARLSCCCSPLAPQNISSPAALRCRPAPDRPSEAPPSYTPGTLLELHVLFWACMTDKR